jgi:hypothetical protein
MTDYRKWMHPSASAQLPRGDYVAVVQDSWIRWVNAQATVTLKLFCQSRTRAIETQLHFLIHQRDLKAQWLERCRLRRLADVMGIGDDFDDSDQLHGIPFRMTVWRDDPMRVSFRPVAGESGERVVRGPVDGDGPKAA